MTGRSLLSGRCGTHVLASEHHAPVPRQHRALLSTNRIGPPDASFSKLLEMEAGITEPFAAHTVVGASTHLQLIAALKGRIFAKWFICKHPVWQRTCRRMNGFRALARPNAPSAASKGDGASDGAFTSGHEFRHDPFWKAVATSLTGRVAEPTVTAVTAALQIVPRASKSKWVASLERG